MRVREVHERFGADRSVGYTGVLKLMQNMHAKGLVDRDDSQRAHIYRAADVFVLPSRVSEDGATIRRRRSVR